MCRFCELKENNRILHEDEENSSGDFYCYIENCKIINIVENFKKIEYEINFCPMCGKGVK